MLNIIYGAKGSGKTQRLIEAANARHETTDGIVLYLSDDSSCYAYGAVNPVIRFVNVKAFNLADKSGLLGFLKGLVAGNYDITDVFIDGPAKFIGADIADCESLFDEIAAIGNDFEVDFTVTVSVEEVPDFLRKYL